MKFEEKLMKLRKEKALSQEDLAEKLDVTRETISKWELGQSKPDMEKLMEISKLFNISLEKLTDDNSDLNEATKTNKKSEKNNLKIALIIIAFIICSILILKIIFTIIAFNQVKNIVGDTPKNFINMFFGIMEDAIEEEAEFSNKMKEQQEDFKNKQNDWMNQQDNNNFREMFNNVKDIYEEELKEQGEEESTQDWYQQQVQKQEEWYQEQIEKQKQTQEEWKKEHFPAWAQ